MEFTSGGLPRVGRVGADGAHRRADAQADDLLCIHVCMYISLSIYIYIVYVYVYVYVYIYIYIYIYLTTHQSESVSSSRRSSRVWQARYGRQYTTQLPSIVYVV